VRTSTLYYRFSSLQIQELIASKEMSSKFVRNIYILDDGCTGVMSPKFTRDFFHFHNYSKQTLHFLSYQLPSSPPFSAEIKNGWSPTTSPHTYSFTAQTEKNNDLVTRTIMAVLCH